MTSHTGKNSTMMKDTIHKDESKLFASTSCASIDRINVAPEMITAHATIPTSEIRMKRDQFILAMVCSFPGIKSGD